MIHGQKRVKKVDSWWIYELNLSFPHVVSRVILAAFIKRRVGDGFTVMKFFMHSNKIKTRSSEFWILWNWQSSMQNKNELVKATETWWHLQSLFCSNKPKKHKLWKRKGNSAEVLLEHTLYLSAQFDFPVAAPTVQHGCCRPLPGRSDAGIQLSLCLWHGADSLVWRWGGVSWSCSAALVELLCFKSKVEWKQLCTVSKTIMIFFFDAVKSK